MDEILFFSVFSLRDAEHGTHRGEAGGWSGVGVGGVLISGRGWGAGAETGNAAS